jgi:hypothetical protein
MAGRRSGASPWPAGASLEHEDATLEFEPESPRHDPAVVPVLPVRSVLPVAGRTAAVRRRPLALLALGGLVAGALGMWALLADRPAAALPPVPPPPAPVEGMLDVTSRPAGAAVHVDGELRGLTPVSLRLAAGTHVVSLRRGESVDEAVVEIGAGTRLSRSVSWTEPPPATRGEWGWLAVTSPLPIRVLLDGEAIGTGELDRILMPPGEHEVVFESEPFGFRETRTVDIQAGERSRVSIRAPEAPLQIQAIPWAEVFIDGERVGDTPLANVMRPPGDYEVVLRHPRFGEQRRIARHRLGDTTLIAVDMRPREE